MRRQFLGLRLDDRVPDAKTLWLFRDALAKLGLVERLFDKFDADLIAAGFVAQKGSIVYASIIEAPRQRNTREDNAHIRDGRTPESFGENPCKHSQKDTDARWVTNPSKRSFGYKNHINVDVQHKLIRKYAVTDAAVHDSQVIDPLLDKHNTNADVFGDSAYRSAAIRNHLASRGYRDRIHRKGSCHQPLTSSQKASNRRKSRIRARVEQIFGRQAQCLGGTWLRCIGIVRARALIGLRNLVYNMDRYVKLVT